MGIKERKIRHKESAKKVILDAAKKLFLNNGYEATSIRKIANEIEFSPATLYLSFKSKAEIAYALHQEGFRILTSQFRMLDYIDDPFERLKAMGRVYIRFSLEYSDWYELMFVQREPMAYIEECLDKEWDEGKQAFETLMDNVKDCRKIGYFEDHVLQGVYTTGKTFEGNELLIPLARTSDGPVEDRYFNFIYQARKDLNGSVDGILVFVIEITDTIRVKRKVEASDKRHNFLLNTMPQQVWTAKPNGELDYVNQVVCDDFGYDADELVGKGWQAFIHLDDLTSCQAKWEESLTSGKEYMTEFRLKFSDGNYYWHLARAIPFIEDGVITSWFGTNTNIDSRKADEFKKDEFLSIASHELKTPLTSIKAYNQIMKRQEVPEKVKPFINKSADHIARLERLIADLLDVTKINAGKVSYAMEQFNFAELLNDSFESMKHTAPKHQLILTGNPDITYDGDRGRLEQVINNFISNAVKYSSEGTKVLINSTVDQDNIIVSVQDFGIGIAKENLHKLFDRYYRVDNTAMRFEGLGLGLYISAEILRRHGGSFWIESEVGEGSTFYFRLPLVQTEKQEVTRTATYYRDRHISINYNKMHNRLDVDWTGFHDIESVKQGCLIMWEILGKNKSDRVVNDNTHVLGNWSEAAEWVGNIWFPMMEKAGLKYFALVFSPSTFSQLSAKKSIDIMAGIITTQYFTDIKLAEAWINEQK